MTLKVCQTCHTPPSLGSFHRDAAQPDGVTKSCKACRQMQHTRARPTARLRDARNYVRRKAEQWRRRCERLLAALADAPAELLAHLPADVRPTERSLRRARALVRPSSA